MIAVLVEFELRDGCQAEFMPLMRTQARTSLEREAGCHRFDICTSEDSARKVILYEVYDDRAAFDLHLASAHFREFDAAVSAMIAAKSVRILDLDDNQG